MMMHAAVNAAQHVTYATWRKMMRWRKMHIEKIGRGIMSSNGKYFITANGFLSGGILNWVVYNLNDKTYIEGFRYQRDAKACAESGEL